MRGTDKRRFHIRLASAVSHVSAQRVSTIARDRAPPVTGLGTLNFFYASGSRPLAARPGPHAVFDPRLK